MGRRWAGDILAEDMPSGLAMAVACATSGEGGEAERAIG